ncbi:unnamed protein product [Durusdinium trenchii]|uniref:TLDc domain-containing protein n=1 Tax=Durusdinium trenchii TaxID=1381693 RepID=A0ABP0NY36_9DINO
MGQGTSVEAEVARRETYGFSHEEYAELQKRLAVTPSTQRVELADFVRWFPVHLRSFVQPLFCYLGKERVGEGSAAWSALAQGLGRVVKSGVTWKELLQVWTEPAEEVRSPGVAAPELELCLELAVSLCYWCAVFKREAEESTGPSRLVAALRNAPMDSLSSLSSWLEGHLPMLPKAVASCLAQSLTGSAGIEPPPLPESRILEVGTSLLLRSCTARLWESEAWQPLYRDWCDGRSFNALLKGALFYDGPALLLLQTPEGHVLGGLSTVWSDNNGKFAGSTECWLFALQPSLAVCKSTSSSGNYFYLNSRNKYAPRGVGFGGQQNFFRLWVDADLEECYVLESDATYSSGWLLPSAGDRLQTPFQVAVLEVWGCGGPEVGLTAVVPVKDWGWMGCVSMPGTVDER